MPKLFGRVFFHCHSQLVSSGSETSNIMVSPPNPQDVARGAGKEVILGDQRIEELFEQIGVAWKEVRMAWKEVGLAWKEVRMSIF